MPEIKQKLLFGGAVFILVLSVIAFVFLPAFGGGSSNKILTFGTWNGKPIQYLQDSFFLRQVQAISEDMKNRGQEVNQFSYYQIMQSAFTASVLRLAMLDELKKAEYTVPDTVLNKYLVKYYLDANGKYSAKLYENTPELTRATRRATLSEELTAQRYVDDIFGTSDGFFGLKTSSKETELIKSMAGPERSFAYASFDTASYPDAEVTAFGSANSGLFVRHSLSLLTFDEEAVAQKVAKSLEKGEITFEDAVSTHSTRSGTDAVGKLAKSYRHDINTLFTDAADLDAVLSIAPGSTGRVIKAGTSWVIVRCDAAPAESSFADAQTIAAVREYMNKNERGKIEDWFMAKAKSFAESARNVGFDAACRAEGLTKKVTAPFAVNYGNVEILAPIPVELSPELSSAVRSEAFLTAAFSLKPSQVSEPILLGKNVVVLQLAEEKAADTQILEMAPIFYNYYASGWSQKTLSDAFLKSDRLEDNFMKTYLDNFLN